MTLVSVEGLLVVSKGALASIASRDKYWTALGIGVSVDKLTVSPGLGIAVLITCECVVRMMIGALVISGFFFPRSIPVGRTLTVGASGEVLGDFLFSLCLELDLEREQLVSRISLVSVTVFIAGGVSGMANSKPTLGFSDSLSAVGTLAAGSAAVGAGTAAGVGTAGSAAHGVGAIAPAVDVRGTMVGAGMVYCATTTLCGAGTG